MHFKTFFTSKFFYKFFGYIYAFLMIYEIIVYIDSYAHESTCNYLKIILISFVYNFFFAFFLHNVNM